VWWTAPARPCLLTGQKLGPLFFRFRERRQLPPACLYASSLSLFLSSVLCSSVFLLLLAAPLLVYRCRVEWTGLLLPFHVLFFNSLFSQLIAQWHVRIQSRVEVCLLPNLCNKDVVACTMTTTAIRKEMRDDMETSMRRSPASLIDHSD
jgi:hypothetical protein